MSRDLILTPGARQSLVRLLWKLHSYAELQVALNTDGPEDTPREECLAPLIKIARKDQRAAERWIEAIRA